MAEPDMATILGLERRVWQALVTGDPELDAALLAPDFLGVYPDGFSGRAVHVGQLAAGPTVTEFTISQERLVVLGTDAALLAYRADYVQPGTQHGEAMYVSSLWQRRDNEWVNIFSQDTLVPG